jgi:hypothetical protein
MLQDHTLDNQLKRDGFILLNANINTEVNELEGYIKQNFEAPKSGFYYSLLNNDYQKNKALSDFIIQTIHSFVEHTLSHYRLLTGSFLVKVANNPEELFLHQDWNYTDEELYETYNVWIPLTDVTEENGALFFLPGSHLWFKNQRSGSLPSARISHSHFPRSAVQIVNVKRGQVVLFDPAVFHGSMPNHSKQNRTIVTATAFSKDAPFWYYHLDKEKQNIQVYHLEDEAFLKELEPLAMGGIPNAKEINIIPYEKKALTAEDLMEFISISENDKQYDSV